MALSDYNLSGEQKRNIAHFASIVRLAVADSILTEGEEKLLKRVAKRFHILEDKYNEILENPEKYPINTPQSYDDRIEYLYDLSKMVIADGNATGDETTMLSKINVGLGFPVKNVDEIAEKAIQLVLEENDLDDFTKEIKRINKI